LGEPSLDAISLAPLVRRGAAIAYTETVLTARMYLVGCADNFCWLHQSLRLAAPAGAHASDRGGLDGSSLDHARAPVRPSATPSLGGTHTPGPSIQASTATGYSSGRVTTIKWGATVAPDCLRNAANRFFYRPPAQLPPQAPASQLSAQVHSFSRVFTGAFLDALAGMLRILGSADDANLMAVSQDLGQLVVDGVHTAPITSAYYSQVAAAMIQADQARNQGRYRTALSSAFIQRGILAPAAAAALTGAPVPQQAAAPADAVAMAGLGGIGGMSGRAGGRQTRLTYNGQDDDAYRRGPEDAPALPIQTVSTDVGITLLVHAPAESTRFAVAPAALGGGAAEPPDPEEAARAFVEHLIQVDRIDFQAILGQVPVVLSAPPEARLRKTPVVQKTPEGPVLKRLHFDCGVHGCR
jgi:hypothetical protein